jgi:putative addiction module killer protein
MYELLYFTDSHGNSPFAKWFGRLDPEAFARVTVALTRLTAGYRGSCRSVGRGIHEYRVDFGPGYRVYFSVDGSRIILLCGGSKRTQARDIARARRCRMEYGGER